MDWDGEQTGGRTAMEEVAATTRPATPVETQVQRLGNALGDLSSAVDDVYERLGSVLCPEAPAENATDPTAKPGPVSALVGELERLGNRAFAICRRVEGLARRIEL